MRDRITGCGCRGARFGDEGHAHPIHVRAWDRHYAAPPEGMGGAGLGVRRPLRFLAFKLQLAEPQIEELARVLNELKTERAQAAVDDRRTLNAFADAVAADPIDEAALREAATSRVQSAERLQQAIVRALSRIHTLLQPEQRSRFAYLIRTGALLM